MRRYRKLAIRRKNNLRYMVLRVDTRYLIQNSYLGVGFIVAAMTLLLVSAFSNGTCGG